MSITIILYLLAAIAFFLGAANVPRVNWLCLGLALLTLSLFVR